MSTNSTTFTSVLQERQGQTLSVNFSTEYINATSAVVTYTVMAQGREQEKRRVELFKNGEPPQIFFIGGRGSLTMAKNSVISFTGELIIEGGIEFSIKDAVIAVNIPS